jgi:hypothetical protein
MMFYSCSSHVLNEQYDSRNCKLSPVSPLPRLPILHPSMFNTPMKTFHLPEYANAMAHQSLTSTSSPILKDFVLKNPRVLKYVDINAVEENVQVHDNPLSVATSHKASSTSDSSSRHQQSPLAVRYPTLVCPCPPVHSVYRRDVLCRIFPYFRHNSNFCRVSHMRLVVEYLLPYFD